MGNLHYFEILDFLLGWFGLDIAGDDYATKLRREARGETGDADQEAAKLEADLSKAAEPKEPKPKDTAKPAPKDHPRRPAEIEPKEKLQPDDTAVKPPPDSSKTPPKPPKKADRKPSKGLEKPTDVGPLDAQP